MKKQNKPSKQLKQNISEMAKCLFISTQWQKYTVHLYMSYRKHNELIKE